jgi:hypothetical protein
MSADTYHASTLREVAMYLEAAQWRQENTARLLRYAAWHAALFQRVEHKRFPSLEKVIGVKPKPGVPPRRQSEAEMKQVILMWRSALAEKFGEAPPPTTPAADAAATEA